MTDVKAPELPEGDSWKIETDRYARKKSLRIVWYRKTKTGGFHVASGNFKPTHFQHGFLKVYLDGLERLARDAEREEQDELNKRAFFAAQAMAAGEAVPLEAVR